MCGYAKLQKHPLCEWRMFVIVLWRNFISFFKYINSQVSTWIAPDLSEVFRVERIMKERRFPSESQDKVSVDVWTNLSGHSMEPRSWQNQIELA